MAEDKNQHPDSVEKKGERNWISAALWADETEIRRAAENYDQVKWYRSVRIFPSALILVMTWLAALLTGNYWDALGVSMILCPLAYLNLKGYRWSFLLLIAFYTLDRIYAFYAGIELDEKINPVVMMIWWVIIVGGSLTAFRIESYRIKHNLVGRRHYLKDTLITLAFPLILFVSLAIYLYNYRSPLPAEQKENLFDAYVTIVKHTTGLETYCSRQGVTMQQYPQQFMKTYANEIALVEHWMEKDWHYKMAVEDEVNDQQSGIMELINYDRQSMIAFAIRSKNGIAPEDFEWKEEYDQELSGKDYCELMDKYFESMKAMGRFNAFVKRVELLKE